MYHISLSALSRLSTELSGILVNTFISSAVGENLQEGEVSVGSGIRILTGTYGWCWIKMSVGKSKRSK